MTVHPLTHQWARAVDRIELEQLRDAAFLREWLAKCAAAHGGFIPDEVATMLEQQGVIRGGWRASKLGRLVDSVAPVGEPDADKLPRR